MTLDEKSVRRQEIILFVLYLTVFFGVAATIALLQPHVGTPPIYGNPPDEPDRYLMSQYIYRHGSLPNGFDEEIRIPLYGISYGFYTMLPYIVQGFVMRFVSLFTASEHALLYAARFVSVFTGTAMAAVVYGIGNHTFADRRYKWLFCLMVMYLPQSLFIHTYVNTDSMAMFSTAVIVYALVRAYQEGFTLKLGLILAVGIIICALSYYNAYGFILSSILLFLFFFLRKEDGKWHYDAKEMWCRGLVIAGVVLLGTGWYFIRNAVLYDGDFLGIDTLRLCGRLYGDPDILPYDRSYAARGLSIMDMLREHRFFKGVIYSFIAAYGPMYIWGSIWFYRFYITVFALGIGAFCLLPGSGGLAGMSGGRRRFFHANLFFCALMPLLLCLYYAYSMDYQYQGRYVMPGVIPFMYFVVAGLNRLAGLEWVPDRFDGCGRVLRPLFSAAVYVIMATVTAILFLMVFKHAVPVYGDCIQ